jgi:hypothetical protein
MPITYPTTIDALTNPGPTDPRTTPDHAGQHSDANDAAEAIETELGTDPSGAFSTLKARLNANSDWDAELVKANTDSFTSTTPANDSELAFSVAANGVYDVEFEFIYSSSGATQDFGYSFNYPTLSLARQANGWTDELNTSDALVFGAILGSTTVFPSGGGRGAVGANATDKFMAMGRFTFVANGAGTCQVKANLVITGGTSKLWAGSRLRYRRLV